MKLSYPLIFFVFFLSVTNLSSQISSVNSDKFLNLDLTKNINDFGYSKWNLQEEVTPIYLKNLSNEYHYLTTFNFDKEIAYFNKDGYITSVILRKTIENLHEQQRMYSEVVNAIVIKYGEPSSQEQRITEWKTNEYKILLGKGSDGTVTLIYNNFSIENFDVKNNEESIIDYRLQMVEDINKMLLESSSTENKKFVRLEDNNLVFYVEVVMTSEYDLEQYVKLSNRLSYLLFSTLVSDRESKKILEKGEFDNIKYNIQFLGNKYSKVTYEKTLLNYHFKKLNIPFTQLEFENSIIKHVL